MKSLTEKQRQLWEYILSFYEDHSQFPSYENMQQEFGYSSSNSIYQHLQALTKKNYLAKHGRGHYDIHPSKRNELSGFYPGIPVKGRISAGAMHEAISENLGHLPVEIHPEKSDHYFALIVDGESMIDADIRDGDYIIIDPREPKDGEIGAIRYRGETTLKTIRKKENGITLQPENPSYDPIDITPDEWENIMVYGTYVGKAWKNGDDWGLIFRNG
ncbi:LexA family transcriptional regulator [Fodinibius sp.]|uniref:LexA family protein n=1 Tax=Fodinibius sp. TaxID=1872440 RepID=UPI002ACE8610|nr:LexA family transcriptional regulator [Fodinibius sp.]MDZ7658774.1 LexA family transcriptional regulator [Fodinibius sp.]